MYIWKDFLIILQKLRQTYNLNKKVHLKFSVVYFILLIVGVLLDLYVPFNFLFNFLRGFVVLGQGFCLFVVLYVYFICINRKFYDKISQLNDNLKRQHKVNLSILLIGVGIAFNVLVIPIPSAIYTAFTGLLVTEIIFTLLFLNS